MRWVRPILIVALMLGLFAATTYMVLTKVVTAEVYLATWSPILSILVGHLWGERAALKIPGQDS